jgi:integrase
MPYKRGMKYIGQIRRNRQKREKVFQTRKEALDWEAKMRQKPENEWNGKTNTACLADWAQAYLDDVKAMNVEKTYKEKVSVFKCFFQYIDPTMPVKELTPSQVKAYLNKQKEKRTGNAANKDRKNLIAAWNWGMEYFEPKLPAPNPCAVKKLPGVKSPRYIPPEEDFGAVYNRATGQDRILLLFTYATAARRGEAFRTKTDDLDFPNSRIRLWTRKREDGAWEYDWVPMPSELTKALIWWLENRPIKDQSNLFYCLEDRPHVGIVYGEPYIARKEFMNRLCKKAGVKPFGFHALRHLRATTLYHQGKSVAAIQSLLRHKSPNTTVNYLRNLGLNVLNEELKDLSLQSGQSLVFEPEEMESSGDSENKKPSEEPSVLRVA